MIGSIHLRKRCWSFVQYIIYEVAAVENPALLDILSLCEKTGNGNFPNFSGDKHDVCITSPFYFRKQTVKEPEPFISNINLKLIDPISGKLIENAKIEILEKGKSINIYQLEGGHLNFNIPIHRWIRIRAEGYPVITRNLYLDYPPHLKLLEGLASGDWRKKMDYGNLYGPGEVPWEAFNYEKTKEVLAKINWQIVMNLNERDSLWNHFEEVFK